MKAKLHNSTFRVRSRGSTAEDVVAVERAFFQSTVAVTALGVVAGAIFGGSVSLVVSLCFGGVFTLANVRLWSLLTSCVLHRSGNRFAFALGVLLKGALLVCAGALLAGFGKEGAAGFFVGFAGVLVTGAVLIERKEGRGVEGSG